MSADPRDALDATALNRVLLQTAPDAIVTIDEGSVILSVNPAAERLSGYREDELVGRPLTMLMPERLREGHRAGLSRYLATGQRRIPWSGTRLPMLTRSGAEIPVEISFGEFASQGRRVFSGFLRDISQRIAHEEALSESRTRIEAQASQLDTIARNATLALFIMDEHQRCSYMNPAAERLTGFTLDELQGRPLHYHIHHTRPDGTPYPLEECPIDQAFPRGMREQGEEVFVHKDGHFYPVAFTASPIHDGGRAIGTVVEVRDITRDKLREREREGLLLAERAARAEAETANRIKSDFLATMSHELRTPLNAIAGHVSLVLDELHGPITASQREALERAQRAQRHLLGLISDVLNYSRLEAGRVEYELVPVAAGEVLADVLPMVQPQLAAKRIEFSADMRLEERGAPVLVCADREKLGQVLVNLIGNAAKFTQPGGHVQVALRAHPGAGDQVLLTVADTGIGIPPERLESIFEPFVQVRSGYARSAEGTGLGLAISRDLARGMGGDITATSEPGRGSTFTVMLRRAAPAGS